MEIYLIRHTKVNVNPSICYGWSDVDLATTYKDEFIGVKNKLTEIGGLTFYSSPSSRCLNLAEYLNKSKVNIDERIKELNFGDWEMVDWDLMDKNNIKEWINDYVNYKCPNGESFKDLSTRVIDFYEELIEKDLDKVVIVAHGGVIRCILSYVLEIPLIKAPSLKIDYGSVSKISISCEITSVDYVNR